jgi:Cft2 family RNA processing exonuclease
LILIKYHFQVIPRYNVRGRNRSSSAKYTNNASLLPTAGVAVRSNSFRVNRNTSSSQSSGIGNTAGTVTPDFCKHIKYCCLHQNFNNARLDNDAVDRTSRSQAQEGRLISLGSQFKFSELNTNNYSNFSDDEKSMKFNKNFLPDANIHPHSSSIQTKSQPQQNYDSFENRKCNCGKLLSKCLHKILSGCVRILLFMSSFFLANIFRREKMKNE